MASHLTTEQELGIFVISDHMPQEGQLFIFQRQTVWDDMGGLLEAFRGRKQQGRPLKRKFLLSQQ